MRLYATLTSLSPQKPLRFRYLLAHGGEQYCLQSFIFCQNKTVVFYRTSSQKRNVQRKGGNIS